MIVAVTGGTGFLGRRVVQQLVARGDTVRVLARRPDAPQPGMDIVRGDLRDAAAIGRLCAGADRLVHMASVGVQARDRAFADMVTANVRGTLEVVDAAMKAGVGSTVITGTVLEYRGGESELTESASTDPQDPYGATKSAAGLLARTMARAAGYPLVYLRIASMLGRDDDDGKLVPQVLRALRSGTPVALTPGAQTREWLHVDDAARAVVASLALTKSALINIGTGVGVSVRVFLEKLCDAARAERALLQFGAKEPRAGEPSRLVMNVDEGKRLLGWRSTRGVDDLVAELASSVKG